jgi:hypothetical protein
MPAKNNSLLTTSEVLKRCAERHPLISEAFIRRAISAGDIPNAGRSSNLPKARYWFEWAEVSKFMQGVTKK